MDRPYLVGPGWWELLDQQFARMREIDPEVNVDVKEKYGLARVDIGTEKDGAFEPLHKIARETEEKSGHICEVCGAPGKIINRHSWLTTMCDRCAALDDKALRPIYEDMAERYFRGSYLRHGDPADRKKSNKRLKDFLPAEITGLPVVAQEEFEQNPDVVCERASSGQGPILIRGANGNDVVMIGMADFKKIFSELEKAWQKKEN